MVMLISTRNKTILVVFILDIEFDFKAKFCFVIEAQRTNRPGWRFYWEPVARKMALCLKAFIVKC